MSAILEIFLVIVLAEILGQLISIKRQQRDSSRTQSDVPRESLTHQQIHTYKPPGYNPWADDDGPDVDEHGYLLLTTAAKQQ